MEFVQCDIVDFYPSISDKLLSDALTFAKKYTHISAQDIEIIRHARKTVLFTNGDPWAKKDSLFDVSMGAFDGAEIAELVGLLILDQIHKQLPRLNFGLYRDDGLAAYKTGRGIHIDHMRKKLLAIFKSHSLDITASFRLHQVDFLDVTFDLTSSTYKPYRKPNDKPIYIHKSSNHPPHILRSLPAMVENRLSSISSSQEEFNEAVADYNTALKASGYSETLTYNKLPPNCPNPTPPNTTSPDDTPQPTPPLLYKPNPPTPNSTPLPILAQCQSTPPPITPRHHPPPPQTPLTPKPVSTTTRVTPLHSPGPPAAHPWPATPNPTTSKKTNQNRTGHTRKGPADCHAKSNGHSGSQTGKKRQRDRNILWYNPPFNSAVTTNIGRRFLSLIDKHFKSDRKDGLHKILNRHKVKLSYSCTPNMQSIINSHNSNILRKNQSTTQDAKQASKTCNCRKPEECPVQGKCMQQTVVYKASVTTKTDIKTTTKTYIGSTENTFKQRYTGHKSDTQNRSKRNSTTLSHYIWDCKDNGIKPNITWEILRTCSKYKCGTRRCDLCLTEKLLILRENGPDSLNKRTELMSRCPHRRKWRLQAIKPA